MRARTGVKTLLPLGVCALSLVLVSACGTLASSRKIDYRNTRTLPSLEVPPDLSQLPDQKVPGTAQAGASSTTYSGYSGDQKVQAPVSGAVLVQSPGVRLARDGEARYVVVNAEPAVVWGQVREFLDNVGLSIAHEDPKAGLIETNWAENRALIGASESNPLSRWMKRFYSTGTRDKYHVRLERGSVSGTTEVYIAHRGMEELDPDQAGAARPGWKPRASDPELEIELLQRLVAQIASAQTPTQVATVANAPAQVPAAPAVPPSAVRLTRNGNGASLLTLEDRLDRAWRRVGLSLDRIGFTVEDRDRSKGIYYVRYIDPDTQGKTKGFFSRMFTSEPAAPPNQFQVQVKPIDSGSSVEVLDKEGDPEVSKTGERILSLLYEQLK